MLPVKVGHLTYEMNTVLRHTRELSRNILLKDKKIERKKICIVLSA